MNDQTIGSGAKLLAKMTGSTVSHQQHTVLVAHLTSTLGSPQIALSILKGLESSLTREQIDVKRAPFGWYKEFESPGKGASSGRSFYDHMSLRRDRM